MTSMTKLTLIAVLTAVLTAGLTDVSRANTILFSDNFDSVANYGNINQGINVPGNGRVVSGVYSTATYLQSGGGWHQVGNPDPPNNNAMLVGGGAAVAVDHNFNGADSAGGITIEFDFKAMGSGGQWGAFSVGNNQATALGWIVGVSPRFGANLGFDGNGYLQPNGAAGAQWGSGYAGGVFHHFEIRCTDPTDNNPFDGAGQTDIEMFVDGVSKATFTQGSGGFANNYVAVQASDWGVYDNLRITQVPEPSTAAAMGTSLLVLLCFGRRRK